MFNWRIRWGNLREDYSLVWGKYSEEDHILRLVFSSAQNMNPQGMLLSPGLVLCVPSAAM